MTSSDRTLLPADAKHRVAARVGVVLDADQADLVPERGFRTGIACAEFNGGITYRLLTGALDQLEAAGCDPTQTIVAWAPGAFELPVVAQRLARSGSVDAVICLGAVIRGETGHYEFVAGECAAGLQRVQLDAGIPVVFGVLTTDTVDQALARSAEGHANKGREAAVTAMRMVKILELAGSFPPGSRVGFAVGRP